MSTVVIILCRHATLSWQQALNEADESWPSKDAHAWLTDADNNETGLMGDPETQSVIIERLNKPRQANPCIRMMTDLPEVSCAELFYCSYFSSTAILFLESLNSFNITKQNYMTLRPNIKMPQDTSQELQLGLQATARWLKTKLHAVVGVVIILKCRLSTSLFAKINGIRRRKRTSPKNNKQSCSYYPTVIDMTSFQTSKPSVTCLLP